MTLPYMGAVVNGTINYNFWHWRRSEIMVGKINGEKCPRMD